MNALARRLGPVPVAFGASLLLSLIAHAPGTLNRDGMLYVRTAQAFIDGGFEAAGRLFNWIFLPVVMALVSRLTGLGLESTGHLLNALFMAGACALMVDCVRDKHPEAAWSACLMVLALPGLNEYRNELLREYGCWFFVMLAFRLALRWSERPGWALALAVQAALGLAALFRPEALTLFPALLLWQLFAAPRAERRQRLAMLGALPLAAGLLLAILYWSGRLPGQSRLAFDLGRLSMERFDAKAQALAAALIVYAREEARSILLFGSLALVPLHVIGKLGLLVVPLANLFVARAGRDALARYPLFAWGIAAHLLVLAVFVLDLQFLAGRYVGLVLLFAVPFLAAGFLLLIRRFPRWRPLAVALALLLALANVVSLHPPKTHFVAAGRWLAQERQDARSVYIDSGRTAYYAGWLDVTPAQRNDRAAIEQAVRDGQYELFVLELSRKDPPAEDWLARLGLTVLQRFPHPNKDAVIIAAPPPRQP
jgi:hypothetical protein